jgi:hypothetical protein
MTARSRTVKRRIVRTFRVLVDAAIGTTCVGRGSFNAVGESGAQIASATAVRPVNYISYSKL